jgi:hypothetical protein
MIMIRTDIRHLTAAVCAVVCFQTAFADARIRTETYSPQKVYSIYAKVGRAALVQLEDGERLKGDAATLGMGDADAWKVGVRGNNIVFKPTADKPATNMIIVSDRRIYVFDLKMADKNHPPTYVMRFDHPDSRQRAQRQAEDKRAAALAKLDAAGGLSVPSENRNYWGRGSRELAPTAAYDNGRFTYFVFDNGRTMPAVYRKEADNSETLLNTHMEDNTVVIHETAARFVLRLGSSVLGVENRGYRANGRFNRTGTDDRESVRLTK